VKVASYRLRYQLSTSSIGVETTVTKAVEQKAIKGECFLGIGVTSNLREVSASSYLDIESRHPTWDVDANADV